MGTDVTIPAAVVEEAERLLSYWGIHGSQPEVVQQWAMHDILPFLRSITGDAEPEPERTRHPVIKRFTHVRCGWTTTDPFTLDVLNDQDVACLGCAGPDPFNYLPEAYGSAVWEHHDGTLWETWAEPDGACTMHRRVITHARIYKSWVNAPDTGEWWVVAEPGTGDLDDNLIVGFDHYWQARAAIPSLRSLFTEQGPAEGIAFRDRRSPAYQLTPPKEGRF